MGYRMINGQAFRVGNITPANNNTTQKVSSKNNEGKNSFQEILNKTLTNDDRGYILSKHAEDRLKAINFTENDMKEIEKGFNIAEGKGSKNSVMLYKDVALIASIENRTLITAIEKDRAKENCFTNVDSVVIL
ncbi:MAG: TIGR02530 family flagellar biosynthesis protein [Clostridium sp.]